jgi:hypothetical protein
MTRHTEEAPDAEKMAKGEVSEHATPHKAPSSHASENEKTEEVRNTVSFIES